MKKQNNQLEDWELTEWQIKERQRRKRKKLFDIVGYLLMLFFCFGVYQGNKKAAEHLQVSYQALRK